MQGPEFDVASREDLQKTGRRHFPRVLEEMGRGKKRGSEPRFQECAQETHASL